MKLAAVVQKSFGSRVSAPVFALFTALCIASPSSAHAQGDPEPALPIVFVHGGAGSAAQYETQAMRWASNDYPNLVTAIDRTSSSGETILLQLDAFFDEVRSATAAEQIYVIAHSLGVAIMNNYLNSSPARSARVAKFIGIDSASAGAVPVCPGNPAPVPCKGIYRSENASLMLGDDNVYLEEHGHTQAVTSEQSFVEQYAFLVGREPDTTLIVPEPPHEVEIAGKLINFPANTGLAGARLELWKVHGYSGARKRSQPEAVFEIGASGEWGPIGVDGADHYEFAVIRGDVDYVGHSYYQPFLRDDYLIRLLATPPGAATVANTARGPDHSSAVVIRYKEWWSDQGAHSDKLWAAVRSRAWDRDGEHPTPSVVDLLGNPEVSARAGGKISIHVHDVGADKLSTLAPIPFFASQPFQAGVDVWLPAAEPPDGAIWFMNAPRGDRSLLQIVSFPNWPSTSHRIGVQFNDYAQEIDSWAECVREAPALCKRRQRFSQAWRTWWSHPARRPR
jgi:pimeloyl-ACP methyl ester carboxylesterase